MRYNFDDDRNIIDAPRPRSIGRWLAFGILLVLAVGGIAIWQWDPERPAPPKPTLVTADELSNNRFTPPPADLYQSPELVNIPVPVFPGANAIWGATGRDVRGHVWIGVCGSPSAHLVEFDPKSQQFVDHGSVLERLNEVRPVKPGESQVKIHSRIVQGADGWLYFASSDENGEKEDGTQLSLWGSHLWRLRPSDNRWEHLMAVPEGLIAVAGFGRYIYALGYWDHVLYQYDCGTGKTANVRVGSVGGHVSRNIICDQHGHVYVPRLRYSSDSPPKLKIALVEFDTALRQVGESRLPNYIDSNADESHGIVGVQTMADQSICFVTHLGYLYRIMPSKVGPALVLPLGAIHPKGRSYMASLFTYDGKRHLMGASRRIFDGGKDYEWIVYDLDTGKSQVMPMKLPVQGEDVLLYGSQTRDNLGNFYLVGSDGGSRRSLPVVLQVRESAVGK